MQIADEMWAVFAFECTGCSTLPTCSLYWRLACWSKAAASWLMLGRAGAGRCGLTRCLAAVRKGRNAGHESSGWLEIEKRSNHARPILLSTAPSSIPPARHNLHGMHPIPPLPCTPHNRPAPLSLTLGAVHCVPPLVRIPNEVGVGDGAGAGAAGGQAGGGLILVLLKVLQGWQVARWVGRVGRGGQQGEAASKGEGSSG